MKKFEIISYLGLVCVLLSSCCGGGGNEVQEDELQPLNITVLLDLSNRLTRSLTPSQMERDTAIVGFIADKFIKECTKGKNLLQCQNSIKVMFYPEPNLSSIATLAENLDVDLSGVAVKDKKNKLIGLHQEFSESLSAIYEKTLQTRSWVGCDIWGFFSNKKIDQYCIKKDYRNVIVILTDGYLFHENVKIKQNGNEYSYILPQTLSVPDSKLIVMRNGLENLEVLMLEVNPYQPTQSQRLVTVLEQWFTEMQVSKFVVSETSMPNNTKVVINSFLD